MKTNKEKKAYLHQYYLDHKEEYKARQREWYLANKEKALQKTKDWYKANPERAKELGRQNYSRHKDKINAAQREHRAKIKALTPIVKPYNKEASYPTAMARHEALMEVCQRLYGCRS